MTVRALFRAVKVESATPPYDTIHLKVLYPAQIETEQNQGVVPADPALAPFPVVIFFGGVNCSAEAYQWLVLELVQRGLVVVTFNWVAENIPGAIALTPGVDLQALTPSAYGTRPTASALPALLAELDRLQSHGVLAGMLDLERIILGGHSAGGRIALESANPEFFPQVVAAFAYGAHTAAPTMLGFEPKTILPLCSSLPLLLIGGDCDGVIASGSGRYGMPADPTKAVIRTFKEAIAGGRNDSYLLLLEGANHFSIVYPLDPTLGTVSLDFPATQPEARIRSLLAETIGLFIDAHVQGQKEASQAIEQRLTQPHALITSFERK